MHQITCCLSVLLGGWGGSNSVFRYGWPEVLEYSHWWALILLSFILFVSSLICRFGLGPAGTIISLIREL
jgi:hypothetical protein